MYSLTSTTCVSVPVTNKTGPKMLNFLELKSLGRDDG